MKFFISFLICLHSLSEINGDKIVHTLTGSVKGKIIKVLSSDVYAYLGIPYAYPPVDKLRFRAPQPISKWHGILDATILAPACTQDPVDLRFYWVPQNLRYMSEDCLYLNIWVPAEKRTVKPFTTMIWIHGGAYNTGSSTIPVYNGRYLASIGNVIVVSFNYRLGSFGFMYLNYTRMPGNMAMLDQVVALQWIYNNIECFGGDRNDITLFGESTGSISITDHMISPLSRGLFRRSILQSGSNYNSYFALKPEENEKKTKKIAMIAGCDTRNTFPNDVINCLLSLKAEDLAAAERKFAAPNESFLSFTEQVDGHFLLDNGINSVDEGAIHGREVMIGNVANEGSPFLLNHKPEYRTEDVPKLSKSEAEYILSKHFLLNGTRLEAISEEYFGKLPNYDYSSTAERTMEAIGDGLFICSIVALAEKLWQYDNTVYFYNFNYSHVTGGYKKWEGVPHFEEIFFVFGMPFMYPEEYTDEEKYFSYQIIRLWTSFAKTGYEFDGVNENDERLIELCAARTCSYPVSSLSTSQSTYVQMNIYTIIKSTFGLFIILQLFEESNNNPVCGNFAGKTIKVLNKTLYAFYGIPYAMPPVNQLRFRQPQPFTIKSNIIYNATRRSPSCMQDSPFPYLEWIDRNPKDLSEDCLYLNIWVPSSKPNEKPFATMVWIHGGAFNVGSANMNLFDGAVIAAVGNVIVVTFNYRLAALSFARFNDEDERGNMGMLDQVMALKWVHRNIETFGGEKNLITVFGQSSGAISIAHHMISPLTKGLFNRVILQSGSNYLEYYAVNTSFNIENTVRLSQEVGCNVSDILTCMRKKNAYEIVAAEKRLIKRQRTILYYHPQVGPPFLSDDPFYDIDTGKFHDVEVLMGGVKDEGTPFVIALNPYLAIENKPILSKAEAKDIMSRAYKVTGKYLDRIVKKYLGNVAENDYLEILKQIIKGISDGAFLCPISHLVERLSQYDHTVYVYKFNHTRIKSLFKKWMGVLHNEDLHFVFGRPLLKQKDYTEEEVLFSRRIIQLWTSFAKTGKPMYEGMEFEWKSFDKKQRNTLSLTLGNVHSTNAEVDEKCEFWKEFLREYTNKMYMH
ncbi:acetylcholinesterase-like [Centruroides sculpturatus]|uniref:acetylcholinesterase-like n=1 Tax=Centruroides sculpturatus TaxID=218467 RepID=UPI000C6DF325|nr:acetylcholinesterase-like [Centruroides sculpturatus]